MSKQPLVCPHCSDYEKFHYSNSVIIKDPIIKCSNCHLTLEIRELDEFMKNRTGQYKRQVANKLIFFTYWLLMEKDKQNIIKATYQDVVEFLRNMIDSREIARQSKQNWRYALKTYFEFIEEGFRAQGKHLIIPVPSQRRLKFSDDQELETFDNENYILWTDIYRILKYFYFNYWVRTEFRHIFLAAYIQAYTGMRVSELVTIQVKDIDLKERRIISGRLEGYSKKGAVLYFVPRQIMDFIAYYIKNSSKDHVVKAGKFLFETSPGKFYSTTSFAERIRHARKKLGMGNKFTSKSFRDAINSERKAKLNTDPEDRKILINQLPGTSVNQKHYLKRFQNWRSIQKLYDRNLPYPALIPLFIL